MRTDEYHHPNYKTQTNEKNERQSNYHQNIYNERYHLTDKYTDKKMYEEERWFE